MRQSFVSKFVWFSFLAIAYVLGPSIETWAATLDDFLYDLSPPRRFYYSGHGPATGNYYFDAQSACVEAMPAPSGTGTSNNPTSTYTNPRAEYHPGYGHGCTYDVTYTYPTHTDSYPNSFYQNWFGAIAVCLNGAALINGQCQLPKPPEMLGCDKTGNPIFPGRACKIQTEVDYQSSANHGALFFKRQYSSWHFKTYSNALGLNWMIAVYGRYLTLDPNPTFIAATRALADTRGWDLSGGVWTARTATADRLENFVDGNGSAYRYYDSARQTYEFYNASGALLRIQELTGEVTTLTYSTSSTPQTVAPFPGLLIGIAASNGSQIQLTYNSQGLLWTMQNPAGDFYTYVYGDGNFDVPSGYLKSVTYPDGTVRQYKYEAANGPMFNFTVLPSAPLTAAQLSALGQVMNITPTADDATHLEHYLPLGSETTINPLTGIIDENGDRFATWRYDSTGRPILSTHANGAESVSLSYPTLLSAQITNAFGTVNTYNYSGITGTRRTVDSISGDPCEGCGPFKAYSYTSAGSISSATDWNNVTTNFSYDSRGLETSRTEAASTPVARTITTTWHTTLRLPTQVNEPGRRTNTTYDSTGNPLTVSVVDTATNATRTWTYTYDSLGRKLTEDGPRTDVSDVTTYTYYNCTSGFQCGNVQTITNALNQVTTFNTYNAHGLPLTVTDPNGVVTTLVYDARQRLTSRSVAGEVTSFEYFPTGLIKKVTLPDASFISYTYDAAHRLTQLQDNEGNKIVYALDAMGNRTTVNTYDSSNALTKTQTRIYSAIGRLTQEIGAAGTWAVTTAFNYDANGNLKTVNAPLGRDSSLTYDELNRQTAISDPLGGYTQYTFDGVDNLTSVRDPMNLLTSYQYTGFGDLKQQTSPDTGITNYTFDAAGNQLTKTDARNKTGTHSYDKLNRLTQIAYSDQTMTFGYDAGTNGVGRLTSTTDGSGSTSWTYTTRGRVASKSQSSGSITKTVAYGYNSAGQQTTLTTPSGQSISFGYTSNRVTSVAVNGTTVLSGVLYDPFGPIRQWTWGNNTIAARTYNQDGNLTQLDSAGLKTYTFDDAFRIAAVTDASVAPASSTTYSYDGLDRLTQNTVSTQPGPPPAISAGTTVVAGQGLTATVTNLTGESGYWLAFARSGSPLSAYAQWIAIPAGNTSFAWNITAPYSEGTHEIRLLKGNFNSVASSAITVTAATPSQATLASNVATPPSSNLTVHLSASPGGSSDWLALASVGSANTSYLSWVYVGAGVTTRDWTVTMPSSSGNYEIRLFLNNGYTRAATSPTIAVTSASPVPGGASAIVYDKNGNRLSADGSTYTNATTSNRLLSTSGALTRSMTYDAAGNITADGIRTFAYNDAGRVSSATRNGTTTNYAINALGHRVKKSNGASTTYFVYDEAGHLIGEYNSTGGLIQEIVWLGDIPVATIRTDQSGGAVGVFYIHTDHLNTPRKITRSSDNAIIWRWDSDPFGNGTPNDDPDGNGLVLSFNLRFPGQYFDSETGINYNYFRDYDPQTGRYVESDPIGLKGGLNTYAYVGGNPISRIDPYGLFDASTWVAPVVETVAEGSAAVATAVGVGILAIFVPSPIGDSPMEHSGPYPSNDPALQQEIERKANEREYHRRCNEPPPPGLDPCERAQWMLKKAMECKAMRKENTNRWWGGVDSKHDPQLWQDLDNAIKNAKQAVDRQCKCK